MLRRNIKAILFIVFISGIAFTQEVTSDPFAANQAELSNKITYEWDNIWNGCNTLVRKPIDTEVEVKRYLECFYGNLPNYFRLWAEENKGALPKARAIIEQYIFQYLPAGENTATDRQNVLRIVVYSHQKITIWHQRMADLANTLGGTNFLVTTEVDALLTVVQKSYESCSVIASDCANQLKSDETMSREELRKKCDEYLSSFFKPPIGVIDKYLNTILNAAGRAERQFPTFLRRSGTDFRVFVQGYDDFFERIFTAFNTCAANLWIAKQQP
jgi:hypothetical protein